MPADEVFSTSYEPKKVYAEGDTYDEENVKLYKLETDPNYKHKINPPAVFNVIILHVGGLYGLYLILTFKLKLLTFLWGVSIVFGGILATGLGVHRGFCHRAFKMTTFARVMFVFLQTMSGQNTIYWWCRDHRLHHKFTDTDADPYNSKRGFFFTHVGWTMTHKHPLVKEKGKTIDMSDIESDKLIMFQRKYFVPLFFLINIAIPVAVPVYLWNEDPWICFFTVVAYRQMHVLNSISTINSVAHLYGNRPIDARITARMSKGLNLITLGESWHNYHHVFPWHPGISEFGYGEGLSTRILYLLEKLGFAYDLKTVAPALVYNHSMRHGDGTGADELNFKPD